MEQFGFSLQENYAFPMMQLLTYWLILASRQYLPVGSGMVSWMKSSARPVAGI